MPLADANGSSNGRADKEEAVLNQLREIIDPDLGEDIVSCGFVRELEVDGGDVSFTVRLTTPACPVKDEFERQVRHAWSKNNVCPLQQQC